VAFLSVPPGKTVQLTCDLSGLKRAVDDRTEPFDHMEADTYTSAPLGDPWRKQALNENAVNE